jgi:hypothetical protein
MSETLQPTDSSGRTVVHATAEWWHMGVCKVTRIGPQAVISFNPDDVAPGDMPGGMCEALRFCEEQFGVDPDIPGVAMHGSHDDERMEMLLLTATRHLHPPGALEVMLEIDIYSGGGSTATYFDARDGRHHHDIIPPQPAYEEFALNDWMGWMRWAMGPASHA